jgi:Zn-dependent M16 (insulinase) family peptidase
MKNEGVIIPSRVSYIGKCASLDDVGEAYSGSMNVLSNILSYTHLWNAIRVQGGAYGAGFSVRSSSGSYVYSYRDPSPASSLKAADGSSDFLRNLAEDSESLDSFIIGAFGDYDALATPRTRGTEASGFALSGKNEEYETEIRKSMLAFDKNELLRLADVTEKLMKSSGVCVFGPKEHLLSCGDTLKELIEI